MKKIHIVKDGTGGKLVIQKEDKKQVEMYLTNVELENLFNILNEFYSNKISYK